METTEKRLLSENEFSRLHLKVVSKSNSLTEADKLIFQEQLELRRQVAQAEQQKKFEERQERLRKLNEERPPVPVSETKAVEWKVFVPHDRAVLLAQFNEQGIATAFQVRAKGSSQSTVFSALTHGGPMGALLLATAEIRKIMQGG